jgi:hypothetical protein
MEDYKDYQPEEMADDIVSILAAFAQDNVEAAHNCQNKIFTKLLAEDSRTQQRLLDFAFEIIGRLAVSDKKNKAVSVAQLVIAVLPTTRQYYPQKKLIKRNNQEYWLTQIRKLNLQYVFMAKALGAMLVQHGELALSRSLFDSIDETRVVSHYEPTIDALRFGTVAQAKHWTVGDEMAANPEFARAQQERFEKESPASYEDVSGEGKPMVEGPTKASEGVVVEEAKQREKLLVVVEEAESAPRGLFDSAENILNANSQSEQQKRDVQRREKQELDLGRLDLID